MISPFKAAWTRGSLDRGVVGSLMRVGIVETGDCITTGVSLRLMIRLRLFVVGLIVGVYMADDKPRVSSTFSFSISSS